MVLSKAPLNKRNDFCPDCFSLIPLDRFTVSIEMGLRENKRPTSNTLSREVWSPVDVKFNNFNRLRLKEFNTRFDMRVIEFYKHHIEVQKVCL